MSYLNVMCSSREPSCAAHCNNNVGKKLGTLVCYHREGMTGFLDISGANKEMKMNKKTF